MASKEAVARSFIVTGVVLMVLSAVISFEGFVDGLIPVEVVMLPFVLVSTAFSGVTSSTGVLAVFGGALLGVVAAVVAVVFENRTTTREIG